MPELGVGMPLEVKLLRPVEMVEAPSSSSVPMPNVKLNKYSITSTPTASTKSKGLAHLSVRPYFSFEG